MATTAQANSKVQDALVHARAAAQELHAALSDVVAKRSGVMKDDLQALPLKAKAIAESIGHSLDAQASATKAAVEHAVTYLESTATQATKALNSTGHDAERSIHKAVADARASVQMISEAVAAKRSAASPHAPAQK